MTTLPPNTGSAGRPVPKSDSNIGGALILLALLLIWVAITISSPAGGLMIACVVLFSRKM